MRGDPKCPNPKEQHGGKPKITHGLDEATSLKVSALAKEKEKTRPKKEHIPDNAEYTIEIDGKLVAQFCCHCGRFVKEASMHGTKEHKGKRNLCPYLTPPPDGASAPAPAPAPSPTPVAAATQIAMVPVASTSFIPQDLPVPVIDTKICMARSTNYDFGGMPHVGANVANAISNLKAKQEHHDQGLDQVEDPEEAAFLAMMVKECGR